MWPTEESWEERRRGRGAVACQGVALLASCEQAHLWSTRVVVADCFYIALFSALDQTHCARMWFYVSEQLFTARF